LNIFIYFDVYGNDFLMIFIDVYFLEICKKYLHKKSFQYTISLLDKEM